MADQKDAYGTTFTTADNKAPTSYSSITIQNGDGTTSEGTWLGWASKNSK